MKTFKQMWRSRTMRAAFLIALLGVLEQHAQIIPEQYRGYALMGIAVVMAYLRIVTTTALVAKQ